MAWDGSGWVPPRSADPDKEATAFPTTDIHGYVELGRRLWKTGLLILTVAATCGTLYLIWRATHAQ